jgi:hypothetical protein
MIYAVFTTEDLEPGWVFFDNNWNAKKSSHVKFTNKIHGKHYNYFKAIAGKKKWKWFMVKPDVFTEAFKLHVILTVSKRQHKKEQLKKSHKRPSKEILGKAEQHKHHDGKVI